MTRLFLQSRCELFIPKSFETRITAEAQQNVGSNAVGRILNSITRTFNNNKMFATIPKWIVVVVEDDVLSSINYTEFGVSGAYGTLIEYLMKGIDNIIKEYMGSSSLPHKVTKYNRPHVLWVEPTLHSKYLNNPLRIKFIRSLHIASMNNNRMVVLPIKQNWNESEPSYVEKNNPNRLSQYGILNYCRALDSTVKYAETKIMRNFGIPLAAVFQKNKQQQEMEKRVTAFERDVIRGANRFQRISMMRQQQTRQQYQEVQRFFNNRQRNNQQRRQDPMPSTSRRDQIPTAGMNRNDGATGNNDENTRQGKKQSCKRCLFTKK